MSRLLARKVSASASFLVRPVDSSTRLIHCPKALRRRSKAWRRDLHFVVPVRNPDFWNSQEVQDTLCSTLGFLSDDQYRFDFVQLEQDHQFQEYLEFNDTQQMYGMPEQVVMFSGGLDSLAGAIDEVVNQKRRVVLVTHKSTSKLNKRHKALEEMLTEKAGENRPHRITVRVHKTKELNHEYGRTPHADATGGWLDHQYRRRHVGAAGQRQ